MTPITTRRFMAAAGALFAGLLLSACGKQDASPSTTAPAAQAPAAANKVYVVGSDTAYAPFEYIDEKGQIVGFDIELVSAVAEKAGIQVKFINTPWEGIFNSLAQGDRDLLVSSITITPERQQTIDFTAPYFDAHQLIAVRDDSKVTRFDDLKTVTVGVQNGTTGDEIVSKALGKTNTNIKRFESTLVALKELKAGGVEAVVADNGVVTHYVANNNGESPGEKFRFISDDAFAPEQYGIAVRKGNTALLAQLNQGLAGIKADGTYDRLYTKYFGPPQAAQAPSVAASATK
jgi:polar amino acid transport system substrate-binding protein